MSLMPSSWEGPLRPEEVTKQVEAVLLGPLAGQASYEALQAEAVRAALWTLCVSKPVTPLTGATVPTRRLLDRARLLLQPLHEAAHNGSELSVAQRQEEAEERSEMALDREFLERLADQGDLLALPGGYWLPAPLRLVPITRSRYLLAGGMPLYLLPHFVHSQLHLHGTFRHLDAAALSEDTLSAVPWQFQACEQWLGPAPPPLTDLASDFDTKDLPAVSQPQQTTHQALEAYVPWIDKPQKLRWQPLSKVWDGRYLLRSDVLWGTRQYSIGMVQEHRLVQQSSELWSTDIRRLCYALDQAAGTPTRVRWNRKRGVLTLSSELPARERKFLSTIGLLQTPEHGYYPRRWTNIAGDDAEIVDRMLEMLAQLGIYIIHEY